MPQRILVVDDEPSIVELVAYNLSKAGFVVDTAGTGAEALAAARSREPSLVILDLMLPEMDGFAVCRELRKWSQVPVLMLTARADEVDRVVGLELGADDYVVKPFSPRELVARVRAILRRTESPATAPASAPGVPAATLPLRYGRLTIDLETYEVMVEGQRRDLTPTEFQILKALCSRPGRVFTRDELLDRAKGQDFFGDARTVDVHVRHLRAKLGDDPAEPEFIETVRGVGYRFVTRGRGGE